MLSRFDKYVEQGLISRKVSPCGRLVLFDYTEKCQWEKAWDEVTLNARGTVYELETGAVVARSFPKFFNFSELTPERQKELMSQSFTVAEKMDGSLGIVYFYDGQWRVNTRGSFVSDQAIKALKMLQSYTPWLDISVTYLVEIIYPENRIVVDYQGLESLTLLAAYDHLGTEVNIAHPFHHEANSAYAHTSVAEIQEELKTLSFNDEGYVVKFADGTRAKFKGDEYVKMHRIISGMSPLVLWESMKNGKVCIDLLASIPEEFRTQYEDMALKLQKNYIDFEYRVGSHCRVISKAAIDGRQFNLTGEDRKALGLYLKANEHELNGFVFPFFLGKGLDDMIMKEIRPKGNVL